MKRQSHVAKTRLRIADFMRGSQLVVPDRDRCAKSESNPTASLRLTVDETRTYDLAFEGVYLTDHAPE